MKCTPKVRHKLIFGGVLFMSKYSYEEKLEAVLRVIEEGMSHRASAKVLGVAKSQVQRWVKRYETYGPEGLSLHNGTYTGEFKQHVIEYMHSEHLSANQTAVIFKMPTNVQVLNWERIYYEEGPEALYIDRRGRKPKMTKGTSPKKKQLRPGVEEDLIKEVQRLRMENEYLKKLNALVQERIKRESGKE